MEIVQCRRYASLDVPLSIETRHVTLSRENAHKGTLGGYKRKMEPRMMKLMVPRPTSSSPFQPSNTILSIDHASNDAADEHPAYQPSGSHHR